MTPPHPSHTLNDTTMRCTLCHRWALTAEMRAPCRGGVREIDWFEAIREFSR